MRILSVDPGPTTGLCLYETAGHRVLDVRNLRLDTKRPHIHLWNTIEETRFDVMLLERFEFRKDDAQRGKIDYAAAEYVGVCRLCMQQNDGYLKLEMVSASTIGKTAFWSDDNVKVRQLGLYKAKAAPHGMDALRHILYHVTFTLHNNYWLEKLK